MNEPKSHFLPAELACKCCGQGTLAPGTLERLEKARRIADTPMTVNSGFRCPEHDAGVQAPGRVITNSAHLSGHAVDIAVHNNPERYKFIFAFMAAGFNRIGIGDTYLHVDDDPRKPKNTIWVY